MRYTINMNTAIKAHKMYVESKLQADLTEEERVRLMYYHTQRVRDFQHERLIHLLVTFFFALLLIGSLAAFLLTPVSLLQILFGALTIILLALELAYIWHYYKLENGVQDLYTITEKLK
jgi:hypothetical protein